MARRLTWTGFEARLAGSLSLMPLNSFLVIEERMAHGQDHSWFVQFARMRSGVLAEAVSNLYLLRSPRLSPVQERGMDLLGWDRPKTRSKHHRNWQSRFDMPMSFEAVAALAVRTLRDVQGVTEPGNLVYKRFLRGGGDLPDPTLGIAAAESAEPMTAAAFDALVGPVLDALGGSVGRGEPGNWTLERGTDVLHVERLDAEPPLLRAYQSFLTGVAPSDDLFARLNLANAQLLLGRALWVRGDLIAALELPAAVLDPLLVRRVCGEVAQMSRRLAGEFGAHMMVPPLPGGVSARLN
jgi:hypothetical protein